MERSASLILKDASVRVRAAFAVIVARALVDEIVKDPKGILEAERAWLAAQDWVEGNATVTPQQMSNLIFSEKDSSVGDFAIQFRTAKIGLVWNALVTALMIVCHAMYVETGLPLPQDVAEVDGDTLKLLTAQTIECTAATEEQLLLIAERVSEMHIRSSVL
jgi:hypothetical protein